MAHTAVADIIVPEVYIAYQQAMTEVKSKLVQSGVLRRNPELDKLLAGGGKTFNMPSFDDLADTDENVSTGASGSSATPENIATFKEVGVRLSRNKVWGSVDLAATLAGADPMRAIAARVAPYWTRASQRAVLATLKGVFADNTANDSADYTEDVSGASYDPGVTDFTAEAFIDATATMGDSEGDLGIVCMHSVVYARARKNNLIDFVPDAVNGSAAVMPTFLGRLVIVDDNMPNASNVYETFIMGQGALTWGVGVPPIPAENYRTPLDANGGGSESLISRVEWCIHPTGHAYIGTAADGGPSNAATANNLGAAGSWNRVAPERKMVKIARLITREA